jgi:PAS domain S-box-containing protein
MQSLRPFLSTPSDAIIAADRDGVIRFWNPGAARLFGYSHDEAIHHSERVRQRHGDSHIFRLRPAKLV